MCVTCYRYYLCHANVQENCLIVVRSIQMFSFRCVGSELVVTLFYGRYKEDIVYGSLGNSFAVAMWGK